MDASSVDHRDLPVGALCRPHCFCPGSGVHPGMFGQPDSPGRRGQSDRHRSGTGGYHNLADGVLPVRCLRRLYVSVHHFQRRRRRGHGLSGCGHLPAAAESVAAGADAAAGCAVCPAVQRRTCHLVSAGNAGRRCDLRLPAGSGSRLHTDRGFCQAGRGLCLRQHYPVLWTAYGPGTGGNQGYRHFPGTGICPSHPPAAGAHGIYPGIRCGNGAGNCLRRKCNAPAGF